MQLLTAASIFTGKEIVSIDAVVSNCGVEI